MRMTIGGIPEGTEYGQLVASILGGYGGSSPVEVGDLLTPLVSPPGLDPTPVRLIVTDDSGSERPPLRLWSVATSVTLLRTIDGEQWETVRRVAPLYFDADLQGIELASDAEKLARDIIGQGVVEHPEITVVIEASAMLITYKLAAEQ